MKRLRTNAMMLLIAMVSNAWCQDGALKVVERREKGLEQFQESQDKLVDSAQVERDAPADAQKKSEVEREKELNAKVLRHRDQAKVAGVKSRDGKSTSALDAAMVTKNRAAYQDKLKELDKRRLARDKRLKNSGSVRSSLPASP
jgi:hypothetical protein